MDECPLCLGIWLDLAAVERLVKERRSISTKAVLGMGQDKSEGAGVLNPPGRMYIKCPECDIVMNRTNFAKRSGIIIDTCRGHGTWFDADELTRVVEFVGRGGIEASLEASLQQEKEALRRERSKVRSAALATGLREGRNDRNSALDLFSGAIEMGNWFF